MADFLQEMARSSRERAAVRRRAPGEAPPLRALQLEPDAFGLIAEVKLRAPSAGPLATTGDPFAEVVSQARRYARAGARAISVLTEPTRFDGDLDHLWTVASAVDVPVMRKDFLVAPSQIDEARDFGASGVLLIAAMLSDEVLAAMLHRASDLGLFVLLEAFDSEDLGQIGAVLEGTHVGTPVLVGLNSRNLRTLEVEPDRLERLAGNFPEGVLRVAESGLRTPSDAERYGRVGYSLALVGTALMRAEDPETLARELVEAGQRGLDAAGVAGGDAWASR